MSAKIKYTDEPLGKIQVIPDFLPSPADIVSPFAFQHGQEQYVLVREIGTKCHLWLYGRVGSAQGYPRRRPLPLLRHGRAASE